MVKNYSFVESVHLHHGNVAYALLDEIFFRVNQFDTNMTDVKHASKPVIMHLDICQFDSENISMQQ